LRDADNGCEDRRVTRGELEPVALEPVDALTVTVLVDNVTDILLVDEGPARRPAIGAGPRVRAPILDVGEAFDALRAEHGFAALVTITREHRILFDTGITPDGVVENIRSRMRIRASG
jgi:7,8-dihydropterin-6-yl-methyl-4-(beta-D-ribofuranosyl)aminobenzene 5'-phosphate synthase